MIFSFVDWRYKSQYNFSKNCTILQFIEYNKENHPILNQVYNILTKNKTSNQGKHVTLYKVPAHMGVKGNKAATNMPGMIPTIRRSRKSDWQKE